MNLIDWIRRPKQPRIKPLRDSFIGRDIERERARQALQSVRKAERDLERLLYGDSYLDADTNTSYVDAEVVGTVDTDDSKSSALGRGGSTPPFGTTLINASIGDPTCAHNRMEPAWVGSPPALHREGA